ncbi:MAG: hypothetical protein JRJ03_00855 [Deltaproteobacteria bacterium]|nr:hypothetical protein [Deltaproteobacteria bacterium]
MIETGKNCLLFRLLHIFHESNSITCERILQLKSKGKMIRLFVIFFLTSERKIFKENEITMSDSKIHIGPAEAVDALIDGIIDAFAQFSVIPSPAANALAARANIVVIACDREKLDKAQRTARYLSATVPSGTYKGQKGVAPALGVIGTADFNKNDSADFVYQITKAILENTESLKNVHPVGGMVRSFTKEEAKISPVPIHPGVLKSANEPGIRY